MITRARIEEIKPDGTPVVYIPLINGAGDTKEIMAEASVVCIPGIDIEFQEGDIVVVGFEDNDVGRPIILGYLKLKDTVVGSRVYGVDITGTLDAPINTTIGRTPYADIFNVIEKYL